MVVKALDAPYAAGRRGSGWLKVKPVHTLDLVVLAAEWGHGRRRGRLSNLHLGARDEAGGGWAMLGKTFKGLTDELLAWQTERLLKLETHREGIAVHVRPELLVEIAFDGVQTSSRYPSGLALRFARVKRYREDKPAAEADTLATVQAIHDGARNRPAPLADARAAVIASAPITPVFLGKGRGLMSRCRRSALLVILGLLIAVPPASADTLVANDDAPGSYTRYDGGTDPTVAGCSTGRRSQNEPSVAVDPRASDVIVAGSNDYCAEIGSGSGNQWPGYYRSTDGGATWHNSLVPGYPGDTSPLGSLSPTKGSCASAGDPTQAFDGARAPLLRLHLLQPREADERVDLCRAL